MIFRNFTMAAAVFFLIILSGCTSLGKVVHSSTDAELRARPASIVTRPTEYAYKTIGSASGEAFEKKILGMVVDGDKTGASVLGGLKGTSPLEALATFRAVKSLKGDAFFKLTTEKEGGGFPLLYSYEKVKVTGRVLKIEDLGTVTAERADKMKEVEAKADAEDKNPGVFGMLFN